MQQAIFKHTPGLHKKEGDEMSERNIPRIMIAGTNSGSGKTTVVCGILAALKKRGKKAASCKCGPDYIDPLFHSQIFDVPSKNIDLFFTNQEYVGYLMAKNAKDTDITVVEGVMGFYDGMQMDKTEASSYDVARATDTPVILVVNCKGMALSVIPVIKGFLDFREDHTIKGVILNGVSEMTGKMMTEMIERELHIKVYGCIPFLKEFRLESRHLGLVTPYELENIQKDIDTLGSIIEEKVLLDELIALAEETVPLEEKMPDSLENIIKEAANQIKTGKNEKKLRIAVGWDKAFCFYYKDNLEFLQEMGCELIKFSLLSEKNMPPDVDALILGGGYPDVYAKELSDNDSMRDSVRDAIIQGMPCMAECGGFMYLHEQLEDESGQNHSMVGVIKGKAVNRKKPVRFGYIQLEANHENGYLEKGEIIKAHEFHYWDSEHNGEDFLAVKPSGKRRWLCEYAKDNLLAGYPHLYFYSNLRVPLRFLEKCRKYQQYRSTIKKV